MYTSGFSAPNGAHALVRLAFHLSFGLRALYTMYID